MDGERYREEQPVPARIRRWGLVSVAVGAIGLAWAAWMDPPGTAGEVIAMALGLTALALVGGLVAIANLVVEVDDSAVDIRWRPLLRRRIAREQIASVRPLTYEPMREFGGWGIKCGRNGSRAYSMSGDRGVEIVLADGKRVVLGSLDPDRLAAALGQSPTSD